jgi:hypothetical protein
MKTKETTGLHYDQSGRAYPDNSHKQKNWKRIWKYGTKFYRIIGLPSHAEWDEVNEIKSFIKN